VLDAEHADHVAAEQQRVERQRHDVDAGARAREVLPLVLGELLLAELVLSRPSRDDVDVVGCLEARRSVVDGATDRPIAPPRLSLVRSSLVLSMCLWIALSTSSRSSRVRRVAFPVFRSTATTSGTSPIPHTTNHTPHTAPTAPRGRARPTRSRARPASASSARRAASTRARPRCSAAAARRRAPSRTLTYVCMYLF
jgi:hypothetical protein